MNRILLVLPLSLLVSPWLMAAETAEVPPRDASGHVKSVPPQQGNLKIDLKKELRGNVGGEAVAKPEGTAPAKENTAPKDAAAKEAAVVEKMTPQENHSQGKSAPVERYVSPHFASAKKAERHVEAGRAAAERDAARAAAAGVSGHKTAKAKKPKHQMVKVLPASKLPADAIVPSRGVEVAKPAVQVWEKTVSQRAEPTTVPLYIVRDPELRWQQYSYP